MTGQPFTLAVPPELVDAIADAVAAKLAANGLTSSAASPYLDVTAAAGYLGLRSTQTTGDPILRRVDVDLACRGCGSTIRGEVLSVREMMLGTRDTFRYGRCQTCGALNLIDAPADLGPYYPQDYYSFGETPPMASWPGARLAKRARTEVLLRLPPRVIEPLAKRAPERAVPIFARWLAGLGLTTRSPICDIGAGSGSLLAMMAGAGFSCLYGIDAYLPEPRIDAGGATVERRDIHELDGGWDLIILNHVLEHLDGPRPALRHLARLLNDCGHILVRVPMPDSWAAREFREHWAQIDAPRHLMVPTVKTMSLLADQAGLAVTRTLYDSGQFQFWASAQYRQDIALNDPRSWAVDQAASPFTGADMADFERRAAQLNRQSAGDSAGFILARF